MLDKNQNYAIRCAGAKWKLSRQIPHESHDVNNWHLHVSLLKYASKNKNGVGADGVAPSAGKGRYEHFGEAESEVTLGSCVSNMPLAAWLQEHSTEHGLNDSSQMHC